MTHLKTISTSRWTYQKSASLIGKPGQPVLSNVISFFDQIRNQDVPAVLTDADRSLLLAVAARSIHQDGHSIHRAQALITWAIRIKKELNEDVFQWVFSDVGLQQTIPADTLILVCHKVCELSALLRKDALAVFETTMNENDGVAILSTLDDQKQQALLRLFPEKLTADVSAAFREKTPEVQFPIGIEALAQIETEYAKVHEFGREIQSLSDDALSERIYSLKHAGRWNGDDTMHFLAIERELFRRVYRVFPYNTQLYTVLGILKKPEHLKGRLAQVKTGEGKSTIVTLLAGLFCAKGHTVDIVTASRYLSLRDQSKYESFFNRLGITTSHICVDDPSLECFSGDIVYGTNTDFEFAMMREALSNRKLRFTNGNARPFDIVIIDEVDNMFIDRSRDSARIADGGASKHQWALPRVFQAVRQRGGSVNTADIRAQLRQISEENTALISDYQIERWIESAKHAQTVLKEGKDYVVKVDEVVRNGRLVHAPTVVIVDFLHTGQLNQKSRWGNGIHEFLELKHHLEMGDGQLTSASLSHPVFFGHYRQIYGLTGTMGSDIERTEIQEIYQVDTFDVPSHLPNRRTLFQPLYFSSEPAYFSAIIAEVTQMIGCGRPSLVLVRTVNDSLKLSQQLSQACIHHQVLNAVQSEEEDYIIARAGNAGMVTVATNTAGRGTDIILSPDSLDANGLHVIFGFYPINDRVEAQGVGRAGRQGQPGSSRIIVNGSEESGILALIDGNDAVVFSLLAMQRAENIRRESEARKRDTQIQRIHFEFLSQFFKKLKNWHHQLDGKYMTSLSHEMHHGKLADIDVQDTQITQLRGRLTKLQTSAPSSNDNDWLNTVKLLIEERVIKPRWAQFYDDLDNLYHQHCATGPQTEKSYKEVVAREFSHVLGDLGAFLNDPQYGFRQYVVTQVGVILNIT